jgi:hypothetical protein
MGLFKIDKPTSINVVVVWPRPNRASANADARFGAINEQQTLPSHHHHQQTRQRPPSLSPPHTNTDGLPPPPCIATSPTAKRAPTASTTAHTIPAQRHVALTTWHVNATLRTCHDDEQRWLGGGGDAEPLGRPRRSPGERAPAGSTRHNHDDMVCHRAQVSTLPLSLTFHFKRNAGATSPTATWQPNVE